MNPTCITGMKAFALLSLAFDGCLGLELTEAVWPYASQGRAVFVAWFPANCTGDCLELKSTWLDLCEDDDYRYYWAHLKLVAFVDCGGDGRSLCESRGILENTLHANRPQIKFGDPAILDDYTGENDFISLKEFVQGMEHICSAFHVTPCTRSEKTMLEKFMVFSDEELADDIQLKGDAVKAAENKYTTAIKKIYADQDKAHYEGWDGTVTEADAKKLASALYMARLEKTKTLTAIKRMGYGLMVSVQDLKRRDKSEM